MAVYLVTGGGKTKIGYAQDPEARFKVLQANSPVPLQLLATFEGGWYHERILHQYFMNRRSHGEWFEGEFTEAEISLCKEIISHRSRERKQVKRKKNLSYVNEWLPSQWRAHDDLSAQLAQCDEFTRVRIRELVNERDTDGLQELLKDERFDEHHDLVIRWINWVASIKEEDARTT